MDAVPTSLFSRGVAPFMFLRTRWRNWLASHLSDRFKHRIKGVLRKAQPFFPAQLKDCRWRNCPTALPRCTRPGRW